MGYVDGPSSFATAAVLPLVLASCVWGLLSVAATVLVTLPRVRHPRRSIAGAGVTFGGVLSDVRTGLISGVSVLVSSVTSAAVDLFTNPTMLFAIVVFASLGILTTHFMPEMIRFADEGYESIHAPVIVPIRFLLNIVRLVVGALYPIWVAVVHAARCATRAGC